MGGTAGGGWTEGTVLDSPPSGGDALCAGRHGVRAGRWRFDRASDGGAPAVLRGLHPAGRALDALARVPRDGGAGGHHRLSWARSSGRERCRRWTRRGARSWRAWPCSVACRCCWWRGQGRAGRCPRTGGCSPPTERRWRWPPRGVPLSRMPPGSGFEHGEGTWAEGLGLGTGRVAARVWRAARGRGGAPLSSPDADALPQAMAALGLAVLVALHCAWSEHTGRHVYFVQVAVVGVYALVRSLYVTGLRPEHDALFALALGFVLVGVTVLARRAGIPPVADATRRFAALLPLLVWWVLPSESDAARRRCSREARACCTRRSARWRTAGCSARWRRRPATWRCSSPRSRSGWRASRCTWRHSACCC